MARRYPFAVVPFIRTGNLLILREDPISIIYKVRPFSGAVFEVLQLFFAKKIRKYLQIPKKSLPLHPHLRKTRFLRRSKVYSKGAGKSLVDGGCSENARFLKKYLQDWKRSLIFAVLSHCKMRVFSTRFFELLVIFERKEM